MNVIGKIITVIQELNHYIPIVADIIRILHSFIQGLSDLIHRWSTPQPPDLDPEDGCINEGENDGN